MLHVITAFKQSIQKIALLISANAYEKYIVSKENCIAHHDAELWFLLSCKYHNLLMGNVEDKL